MVRGIQIVPVSPVRPRSESDKAAARMAHLRPWNVHVLPPAAAAGGKACERLDEKQIEKAKRIARIVTMLHIHHAGARSALD